MIIPVPYICRAKARIFNGPKKLHGTAGYDTTFTFEANKAKRNLFLIYLRTIIVDEQRSINPVRNSSICETLTL